MNSVKVAGFVRRSKSHPESVQYNTQSQEMLRLIDLSIPVLALPCTGFPELAFQARDKQKVQKSLTEKV